jgi:prepilin-type N-terminal cleavage/methylation domain-containing protein
MKAPPPEHRGFTLIELLVVLTILAVVFSVIAASVAAGVRVWATASKFGVAESESVIGLQIMERDLMNAIPFYAISPAGSRTDISFASIIVPGAEASAAAKGDIAARRIGTVSYVFDGSARALLRTQVAYGGAPERAERIVSGLTGISMEYYRQDGTGKGHGTWQDSWTDPTNLPAAVSITLSFVDREGGIKSTVVLPVWYSGGQK